MTPLDDPLAPVPRDLTAFNITIPKYPNSASCFTCRDRIAAREARARKGAKRARVMHLRCCGLTPDELAGVSGWQDVSDVQRDCLVRDIYDEKEIKTSAPAPLTEVEACLAQEVTLESELWTFDEVEWHETAQDTTTIKYQCRHDQRLPNCANELPKLPLKRLDHNRCVPGNSSSPLTRCSSTPQTPNGPTTQASPRQSGPVLCRLRQETHSKYFSSSQLWKTGTDGDRGSLSRASAEWPPLLTSRETGPNSIPSPKRRLATPRPSPSLKAELPLPAFVCYQIVFSNSHGTWWWKVRALDVDD